MSSRPPQPYNGARIRPPMHIYHMSRADALAIIAYLRSVREAPGAGSAQ